MTLSNPTTSQPPTSLLQIIEQAYALSRQGKLPLLDLLNIAQQISEAGCPQLTLQLYQLWLKHTESPVAYVVQFNFAVTLSNCQDDAGAEQAYRAALAQKPDFIEGNLNLGTLLERTNRPDEALAVWRKVLTFIDPETKIDLGFYIQALNNLGRLLEIQKKLPEAEAMLETSLKYDPHQPNVMTHWVHIKQKLCNWPVYGNDLGILEAELIAATSSLAMLSISDDPALQLQTAKNYVEQKVLRGVNYLSSRQSYHHQRVRIAYLSGDFCSHAVSILTAELYGLHDRTKFEVFGFCWSHEDGSPLRARVIHGMDHHIKIGGLTDEQAANLIRSCEIDILVDLHGLTLGTRHNILAYRPAPLQITWLGFPGSTAQPEIDYVVCDDFVLPPEFAMYFTEKPLRMPQVFQINDRERLIDPAPLSREICQLPVDSFVFCSFNNTYKLTPEVFSAWMRIMKRVPNSILWLISDNETVRHNLCHYAKQQGVAPERLIFAERVVPSQYLARLQLADLFLDTFPFGGGTTASDALWSGLPLLALAGRSFASRMAGSLLTAVGLPELITYNLREYEEAAVSLAQQPELLLSLRKRLQENLLGSALFDTPRFVHDLEQKFLEILADLDTPKYKPANLPKQILIEGWKEINHSFAMVNQYQLLEMLQNNQLALFHQELSYPAPSWYQDKKGGGFGGEATRLLANIPAPAAGQEFDCVMTIAWPFRRASVKAKKVLTFMVTEFGLDNDSFLEKGQEIPALIADANLIVTPTRWAKEKIVGFNIPSDKVVVVPHGVDTNNFYPSTPAERESLRQQLGVTAEHFVFLNLGVMSWNKGVDILILAFAHIHKKYPQARMVFKDSGGLYGTSVAETTLHNAMKLYPDLVDDSVRQAIVMVTSSLSLTQLRLLYGSVDSYVSPYRAEGFNLPVIEAIACGTKVIVSAGGATDDFCDDDTSWKIACDHIESQTTPVGRYGYHLEPQLHSLVAQMEKAITDQGASTAAFERGRQRLIKDFSWAACTQKLVALMLDSAPQAWPVQSSQQTPRSNHGKSFRIYCDGGFANRFNGLVSGLAMCNILNMQPEIIWPTNSWCGAAFTEIFETALPATNQELLALRNQQSLDRFLVLTNQDQSTFLDVPYRSPQDFDNQASFIRSCEHTDAGIFYHFPLIPSWIPAELIDAVIMELPFKQNLLQAAEDFIAQHLQSGYFGIHLRRTDLVVGFTNEEVTAIAAKYPDQLFFICTDSVETERELSIVPNLRFRQKAAYVELKVASGDWCSPTLDDSGRAYYSNVTRSAQSVLDAVIDLIILSRAIMLGTGGSTFFGLAKRLQVVGQNSKTS